MFFISLKTRESVLQIHATRIKAIAVIKITNFEFIRGKNTSLTEIKGPKIEPCGMSLTTSLQLLNLELSLILFVRFFRKFESNFMLFRVCGVDSHKLLPNLLE